jgi:RNA ligase (TIGR02306 family)
MSKFVVEVKRIDKVWNHPNADRLDLASVEGIGFQFVVGRGSYKVGDEVVYFPIDAELPLKLQRILGLEGKLSGKFKNRLKTLRLRGEISQGFVCPIATIADWLYTSEDDVRRDKDLACRLGVTKYEQPAIPCENGNLVALPAGVDMYDIEGCENFPRIVNILMDQQVFITEKVEGQNYGVTAKNDGTWVVNQRKHAVLPVEDIDTSDPVHYKALKRAGKVHKLISATIDQDLNHLAEELRHHLGVTQLTIRGEYLGPGVQKNIYNLDSNRIRLFDILADGKYVSPAELQELSETYAELQAFWVPVIAHSVTLREWLAGRTIVEASHGQSELGDTLREGIVIKPMIEQNDPEFGRLIIKQRDPIYLDKMGF